MWLMQLAGPSDRLLLPPRQDRGEEKGAQRRRDTGGKKMYGGRWVEKGWERGGGREKGTGREPVRRKKRQKGQDIVGGGAEGENFKKGKEGSGGAT